MEQEQLKWNMRHEQHECVASKAQVLNEETKVRHGCYTNGTSATRMENFDFDNDSSENIFSHPYICYVANERLQGEQQFHYKNYFLETSRSHAKIHLKNAPQKLNFVMVEAI